MGKSIYNGTSPYEYVDFLERRNAELEEEVEQLRKKVKAKDVAIKTIQNQRDEREEHWRDWNGRAANRAALLEAANERLRKLLKQALRHIEDAGDDTLAAIIDTQIGSDTNG